MLQSCNAAVSPAHHNTTTDKREQARLATAEARRRVESAGFGDLFLNGFLVLARTDEELAALGVADRDWAGGYVGGSIDWADHGLTALLNLDKHENREQMADTLCHECGHGLWELLDDESQVAWTEAARHAPNGPLEAFADHFMFLTRDDRHLMAHPELFERVVAPNPK